MSDKDMTVAVLGAGGTMGYGMARNLAKAGLTVRAWNRTRERAEPLAEDGATICDTPEQAADGAGVLLTMLPDADAVLEQAEPLLRPDMIWLQTSTIGEAGTERCQSLAQDRGVTFIDAPVLGTKAPAEEGKLIVLASGPEETVKQLKPIFDAIGQRTMYLGDAGRATQLKLVTNAWIVSIVEATAETCALAEGLGIEPQQFLDAVGGGALDLPYLQMKGKAIIERDFTPSFKLKLAAKDASLVQQSAGRRSLELPMLETIAARLAKGAELHGDEDMISTYLQSAPGR